MQCRGAGEARTEPYLSTVREYWSRQLGNAPKASKAINGFVVDVAYGAVQEIAAGARQMPANPHQM